MRVAVGSDHRGFQTMSSLVQHLRADGHEVMVTREPTRTTDVSTLPAGWTMSPTYTLGRELKVELFGKETENFRTSNGDSFQGPMPPDFDLSQYAK